MVGINFDVFYLSFSFSLSRGVDINNFLYESRFCPVYISVWCKSVLSSLVCLVLWLEWQSFWFVSFLSVCNLYVSYDYRNQVEGKGMRIYIYMCVCVCVAESYF